MEQSTTTRDSRRGWRPRSSKSEAFSGRQYVDPLPIDTKVVLTRGSYRLGRVSVVLSRYARIRGDLSIAKSRIDDGQQEGIEHAILCADSLAAVKSEIEARGPKLSVCANLLGMADRELVSLYQPEVLSYRANVVADELEGMRPKPSAQLARLREMITTPQLAFADAIVDGTSTLRVALKDALEYIHGCDETALIEDDLQVTRLKSLLVYFLIGWVVLLVSIPFVTTKQTVRGTVIWPTWTTGAGNYLDLLVGSAGLSVVGAVGGVISGMFGIRDSKAVLGQYRTSMLKLGLKPAVGALAALTLYIFLSAGVISGIAVTSGGVYLVAAFLAGFSERYFLRVLRTQEHSLGPDAEVGLAAMSATLPSAQASARSAAST